VLRVAGWLVRNRCKNRNRIAVVTRQKFGRPLTSLPIRWQLRRGVGPGSVGANSMWQAEAGRGSKMQVPHMQAKAKREAQCRVGPDRRQQRAQDCAGSSRRRCGHWLRTAVDRQNDRGRRVRVRDSRLPCFFFFWVGFTEEKRAAEEKKERTGSLAEAHYPTNHNRL